MTIAYDYYPFIPRDFAATIALYLDDLRSGRDGYFRLRSAALALFDTNDNVKQFASDYGGWDRNTITTELTENDPTFWLLLFLYEHFSQFKGNLTWQSASFPTVSYIAHIAGWSQEERDVLTQGKRSFKDFAQQWLSKEEIDYLNHIPDFWDHFHPACMYGHVGWLDVSDIQNLLEKLSELESVCPHRAKR